MSRILSDIRVLDRCRPYSARTVVRKNSIPVDIIDFFGLCQLRQMSLLFTVIRAAIPTCLDFRFDRAFQRAFLTSFPGSSGSTGIGRCGPSRTTSRPTVANGVLAEYGG